MKVAKPFLRLPIPQAARFDRYLKRRYVKPGQTQLSRERIFILPSYHGLAFGLALFIMLMGALNYNNSLAFMLTFLLSGVALVVTFHTYRNMRHLTVRPVRGIPTFAGQLARFDVQLINDEERDRFAVTLHAQGQQGEIVDVAANSVEMVQLAMPTHKRGRLPLGIVTVESRFPLGLYHAWSYVNLDMHTLVYPAPAATTLDPGAMSGRQGDKLAREAGTDDFVGFRSYQPGDSPRHLNWKALARERGLLTKQYATPEREELWLNWDDIPVANAEERLSILCRWVLDAAQLNAVYGLRLPGIAIAPNNTDAHKTRCLEALALFEAP